MNFYNKITNRLLVVCLCITLFSSAVSAEMTADEIVKKTEQLFRGDSSIATAEMTVVNPDWTRTMKMKMWSEG
ncbi:MAG: hypothetical protein ACLFQV_12045, partial [Vulcanimicrobiota bacterium]